MNRFLNSQSLLFQIVTSLFIVTFSCDEVNLGDLFHGIIVLHNDEELAAVGSGASYRSTHAIESAQQDSSGVPRMEQSGPLVRFGIRVAIDQDAPSLATNGHYTVSETLVTIRVSSRPDSDKQLPTELLHLRFHFLLI